MCDFQLVIFEIEFGRFSAKFGPGGVGYIYIIIYILPRRTYIPSLLTDYKISNFVTFSYSLSIYIIYIILPVCKYVLSPDFTSLSPAPDFTSLSPGGGAGPWAATFTGLHQLETWAQPTCEACCER